MAENEYLDSSKARRWLSVAEGIRDDADLDDLTDRVRDRFYKTLKAIRKDLPFVELVGALHDIQKLSLLCEGIEGASDVKDFLLHAASGNVGTVNILERFLIDALQNCLYDIPYLAARLGADVNLSDARRNMKAVQGLLASDIRRIATKLAENPSWKLQRPRTGTATPSLSDTTRNMLSESLIVGFRK